MAPPTPAVIVPELESKEPVVIEQPNLIEKVDNKPKRTGSLSLFFRKVLFSLFYIEYSFNNKILYSICSFIIWHLFDYKICAIVSSYMKKICVKKSGRVLNTQ